VVLVTPVVAAEVLAQYEGRVVVVQAVDGLEELGQVVAVEVGFEVLRVPEELVLLVQPVVPLVVKFLVLQRSLLVSERSPSLLEELSVV